MIDKEDDEISQAIRDAMLGLNNDERRTSDAEVDDLNRDAQLGLDDD